MFSLMGHRWLELSSDGQPLISFEFVSEAMRGVSSFQEVEMTLQIVLFGTVQVLPCLMLQSLHFF